jgi:putative phosphoribosyl transferase
MPNRPGEPTRKSEQRPDRIRPHTKRQKTPAALAAEIKSPAQAIGVIILPVSVPGALSSRALRRIATGLRKRGFATLLAELLMPSEAEHGYHSFDFQLLARRIADVTESLRKKAPEQELLPIGYLGMSTDAAAIATAAAAPACPARALVMCDARLDLAHSALPLVHAPTLFIVKDDELALDLNRSALAQLRCPADLAVLRGACRNLPSADMAAQVVQLAGDWFTTHLRSRQDD